MDLPTQSQAKEYATEVFPKYIGFMQERFQFSDIQEGLIKLKVIDRRNSPHSARRVIRKGQFSHYEVQINIFHLTRYKLFGFTEYSRFEHQPIIGSFSTTDWRLYIDASIAHEMAHVAQFLFQVCSQEHPLRATGTRDHFHGLGELEVHHGPFFQNIYREFREEFINHLIVDRRAPVCSFEVDDLEERVSAMEPSPYRGIKVRIGNADLEILGLHPDGTKKLYRYLGKTPSGRYLRVKLRDIVAKSSEAEEIMYSDEKLIKEYRDHLLAIMNKKRANAKSSLTKSMNRRY